MSRDVEILPTAELAAGAAAGHFARIVSAAIGARGRCVVALAGGTTPARMYELLATGPLSSSVEWPRVEVVWGDERCVPPEDGASNYRMARIALLDRVPVTTAWIHRIRGEDAPAAAAAAYEAELRVLFETPMGPPGVAPGGRLDLVILGLGEDCHTASLFPRGGWVQDTVSWVRAEPASTVPTWRVTLTPSLINASAEVIFLVAGSAKAASVRQVLEGPPRPAECPAQAIVPTDGRVTWYVDAAAAAQLQSAHPRRSQPDPD